MAEGEAGIDRDKPVLVTGASGFVGSHVARLLVRRGRKVRALVRRTSNIAPLQGLALELVHGDALDPASLRDAMAGCATVFHNVVDARMWLTDPTPMRRNNVDGLTNAMDAGLACGVERFVFTSTMGTLGINPDGPVTEDIPFNWHHSAPAYIRIRLEAENRFLDYCRNRNLPGVALCVANTYGPEDWLPTPHGNMLREIALGRMRVAIDAGQPTVDIRDVAEAALLAEHHGRIGERYIIANEFAHAREFYGMAVAQTGQPMPRLIPYRMAAAMASAAHGWAKLRGRKDNRFSPDAMYLAKVFGPMDNGKARRELRWTPRPLAETVRDAVAWFAQTETAGAVQSD